MKKIILFVSLCMLVILLYICIPYRAMPSKLTKKLEKRYGRENDFQLLENYKDGTFKYLDKSRNLEFLVYVEYYGFFDSDLFPIPHISVRDNLNAAIIEEKTSEAKKLAKGYNIFFNTSGIYVDSFGNLDQAGDFFFELTKMYALEKVDLFREDVVFYYKDYGNDSTENPIQLDFISYIQLMEDGHYLYFKKPEDLSNHLKDKWIEIEKFNPNLPKH